MRTTTTLLAALALFGATSTALAAEDATETESTSDEAIPSKGIPVQPDTGADPVHDPYTNHRGLTEAPMEYFRELTVDPTAFAATAKPARLPPLPAVVAVTPALQGTGAGANLRLVTKADAAKLIGALNAAGHKAEQGEGFVSVTVGDLGLLAMLDLRLDGKRVADLATAQYEVTPVAPAEPVAPVKGKKAAEPAAPVASTWEAYSVQFAPVDNSKKTLVLENTRSSWASVTVNGTKVGIIGPYTTAYINGVPTGSYDLGFTFSNGYELKAKGETVAKVDAPRSPGVTPFGMPAPGR